MLYATHEYTCLYNVFSTYVFPKVFQTQLWLRHLFLLLRSFSDMKLLQSDENKPLSLLLSSRWAGLALHWALGDAHVTATLLITNPREPKRAEQQSCNLSSILELSLGQGAPILVWRKSTQYTLLSVGLAPHFLPPQECRMLWNHSYRAL